jgi:hypothetical protein
LLDDGAIEIWLLKKLQESSFMITDPELLSVRAQMATLVIAYQADRSKNCLLMKKITADKGDYVNFSDFRRKTKIIGERHP